MIQLDPGDGGRPMPIPAITIFQPWGTLVAERLKPYEFRGHQAPKSYVGRRVAIHAGARPVRVSEVRALLVKLHSASWRDTGLRRDGAIALLERIKDAPKAVPLGSVLCTATLGAPIRNDELARELGIDWVADSGREEHSMWGWPLSCIERLRPPLPAVGRQGWWYWAPPAQ